MNSADKTNTLKVVKTTRKPTTRRRPSTKKVQGFEVKVHQYLIPTISCLLPLFAVGFTRLAGSLFQASHNGVGVFIGAVCSLIYITSLKHGAQTIRNVTKVSGISAWMLAIAFDGGVVGSEMVHSLDDMGSVVQYICVATMVVVGLVSASLNYCAFKSHQRGV